MSRVTAPSHQARSQAPKSSVESIADLRLIVFSDSYRHRNGVGAYYCDLIASLEGQIDRCELVCPGPMDPRRLWRLQGLSIPLPGDATQRLCLPGLLKARAAMRRVRPHVVIIATPGPYGIVGMLLAKLHRVVLCVGYHTQYDKLVALYWDRVFGGLGRRYLKWLDGMLFRRGSMVFTNSEAMVDSAKALGAREVRLVGTPVEPIMLAPETPPPRQGFGPVLFVGRLAREKNVATLINAARQLPSVSFRIAGDGPMADELHELAADVSNVRFLGWLGRQQLVEALDASEMLVLPSKIESFGTVAIEAMARGRMVLVSEHCGITEWPELRPGVEVFRDDDGLTAALERYIGMPEAERDKRRAAARKYCQAFAEKTIDEWRRGLLDAAGLKRSS